MKTEALYSLVTGILFFSVCIIIGYLIKKITKKEEIWKM